MSTEETITRPAYFVTYCGFKIDPAWRRLPLSARADGRATFAQVAAEFDQIKTYAYSTIGFKTSCELLLWRKGSDPKLMQEMTAQLLQTGIGQYMELTYNLFGFTRASTYTKRPTTQEQAIDVDDRQSYLIVYPFAKTTEWFLMSRDARQGMMNEHMRIGHDYADIPQVLLYSTGLDDQEFIVAYECEELPRFSALVTDLRATEARRYTLRDTPILTGAHYELGKALELIG